MTELKNLRDLLFHLKSKYMRDNLPDEYEKHDKKCREKLYDMVADNVNYFTGFQCNLNEVLFSISVYSLTAHKPNEICELAKRFNESATGIYGLEYDNQTELVFTDIYGNPFKMLASGPGSYSTNYCEFHIYTMSGQGLLYKFTEPSDAEGFSLKHIEALKNMRERQKDYYEEIEKSRNRYKEIKKYKDYISVEYIRTGYACCFKKVTVKKDIPIELSMQEIAKYADDWNYCFGGSISQIDENEKETVYEVKIHTD